MMITYEPFLGGIRVKLNGKRVGVIQTCAGGFHYVPAGSRNVGDTYPTVDAVKRSLEEM